MARYSTLTNEPIDIDVAFDYINTGWSISGSKAIHESCNSGYIRNSNFPTEAGKDYTVVYTITGYSSGEVYAVFGGTDGVSRTANGTYTETITASDTSGLSFWSDGDLEVSLVNISDAVVPAATIVFNEKYKVWAGDRSYTPELATKFLDDVFVFRNGVLWKQMSNTLRNNWFGEQFPSIITFYININPSVIKTLSSIRIVGNMPWDVTEVEIRPRAGKTKGQLSRIKKGNFKNLQGQWFADFLRDLNDPRFGTETERLFKGAVLQGEVAKITLEINETGEVRLFSVDVLGSESQYSY